MSGFGFNTAVRTHVGKIRERNEDSHLARPEMGLWVVADGMGGHSHGDRASQLVTSSLAALATPDTAKDLFKTVRDAIERAHEELQRTTEGICGCTVVALLAFGESFACVWAGDSRIYRSRQGRLELLTRDHNLAEDMIARGTDKETAHSSPLAHRLTRAVGIPGPLELEVDQGGIEAGDVFLLCSDGLTGELDDRFIERQIATADLEQTADAMVEATLDRGARDNVTLILVQAETERSLDLDTTIPRLRS